MILSVPTTWEEDYLLRLKDYPEVGWLYGSLPTEIVGSGRQAALLPAINRASAAEHIRQAQRLGFKFNYLVNTSCLGNREYTRDFHRAMLRYIEWVAEQNPDMITVTLPFIAQIIKKRFPALKISVSKYANVDSLEKAKFWEDLGADEITIPDDSLNRDFKMLRLMRETLRCGMQVFANLACLRGCPFAHHHANLASHGSQRHEEAGGVYLEYCLANCKNIRVRRPVEIIKSGWIRPEDLHHYEELGISKFKLVDRSLTSRGLLKRVKAYSERKYIGNLADIICLHTKRREHRFAAANLEAKEAGLKEKLRLMGDAIFAAEKIYLDNQMLDGFLSGIKKIDCRYLSCDRCGYCDRYAQKAISFSPEDREEAIRRSDLFLQKMTSSEIFDSPPPASSCHGSTTTDLVPNRTRKREKVRQLMKLKGYSGGVEQRLKSLGPLLPYLETKEGIKTPLSMGSEIKPEEVMERMMDLYEQYWGEEEIDEMLVFFQNPVGEKLLASSKGLAYKLLTVVDDYIMEKMQETKKSKLH